MAKLDTQQRIEKIIYEGNHVILACIDPEDTQNLINAKFGIIDSCIKELAKSIDEINRIHKRPTAPPMDKTAWIK